MSAQHSIVLPAILDISAAADLLVTCRDMQDQAEPVTIDASAIERITTPAFQVLIALIKTRKTTDKATQLHAPSPAFSDAASALGFTAFLKEEAAHG